MQPIDQGRRSGVQGIVVRHGSVETVVLGNDEALEYAEHCVFVEERAGVEATERVILLQLAAGTCETGIRHGHGAAGDVLLLEKGDFEAFFEQAGRGGEACGACAHDHDVGIDSLVFALFGSLSALLELRDVGAGIGNGLDGSILDSGARCGCTGNGVNVEVLGLDDLRRPHLGCKAANADGLVVGKHAQVRDGAARHGGFDVDVILVAHSLGGELAVGCFFQRGGRSFCRRLRRFGLTALCLGSLVCRGRAASPIAPIAEMPARAPVPFKKLRRESSIMKPLLVVEGQCVPLARFAVFGIRIAQSLPCFACLVWAQTYSHRSAKSSPTIGDICKKPDKWVIENNNVRNDVRKTPVEALQ